MININITNHAYERYCERFLKIDKMDIKSYIYNNKESIAEEILSIFENSIFLWEGAIIQDEARFYISEDIIFVVNKENQAIITLYKINFGFDICALNKKIINEVLNEILTLQKKLNETSLDLENNIFAKEIEIKEIDGNIDILQKQIDVLVKEKNILNEEVKHLKSTLEPIKSKIRKHTIKLVYSTEYKLDFERNTRNIRINE